MVFNNENEMILLKQLNETAFMNGNKMMKKIFFCAALCGNYVKHEFICTTTTREREEKKIRKFNGDVIYVVHYTCQKRVMHLQSKVARRSSFFFEAF